MEVDRSHRQQQRDVHTQAAFVAGRPQVERAAARDDVSEDGFQRERRLAGEARDEAPDLGTIPAKEAFRGLEPDGFRRLTKKPLRPTDDEVRRNPRSRSARLRGLRREAA